MYHPDQIHFALIEDQAPPNPPKRSACLVAGCPCKDARFVSHRRAEFFAALARRTGQTADRVVSPDPDWAIGALGFVDGTEVAA